MTTVDHTTGPEPAATLDDPAPASTSRLCARGVVLAYDERVVVDGVDLDVPAGEVTVIIGANACGKSTLLKALARLLRPRAGGVYLDGEDIRSVPTRAVALEVGLLPQSPVAPEGVTVGDLVARGRAPHQRWWQQWSTADELAVTAALDATGTTDLADRPLDELSGGQRQRVWLALALAQETDLLLLDEPTTFLDVAHQVEVLELVGRLNRERGRTVVMVLHDLNHAARYADHVVAMKAGRVVAQGTPQSVLTPDVVADVFGLDCVVVPCPVSGRPLVVHRGEAR
jgi:iron complex transport system ATP-binding protein